ncbi:MAG TPA: hydrogenase expression/formation protein HypE [Phycisphaerales bacterium]|nr:hydrogenase expression/formation protein HypE [Phycisphaerales bacterium]
MPPTTFNDERISMQHGAGGRAARRLVEGVFAPAFSNESLDRLGDAAILDANGTRLALTTDTFVVSPHSFPGGCIGSLAVHGTINDLAVSGAEPLALSAGFVLEAGLDIDHLREQVDAMADAARAAGVPITTGDTKVVENGKCDGLYINTTGLGIVRDDADLAEDRVRPGDAVLVSGPIGDHGITVMIARGEIDIEADLVSDSRSVLPLTRALIDALGGDLRWMRDATRGGVATVLNELTGAAPVGVVLEEQAIPVRDSVRGACELLGLDPLHVANEGQFVAVVAPEKADDALRALAETPGGRDARVIGSITTDHPGRVVGRTPFGAKRIIDILVGDPLPRIC